MNQNTQTIAIVRAIHDWNGEDGQLTFSAGDLIHVKVKNEDGFWEGVSSNGIYGYFPENYTEEVANLGNVTRARASTLPIMGRPEGLKTVPIVKSNSPNAVQEKPEKEKGEKNGLFSKFKSRKEKNKGEKESSQSSYAAPSNPSYNSIPSFEVPQQQYHESPKMNYHTDEVVYARAIRDFDAGRNVSHLSFSSGEFLQVKEKYPTGWWKGEIVGNRNRIGLFPSKDVEIVDESQVERQDIDSIPDFVPQMVKYGSPSPDSVPRKQHEQTVEDTENRNAVMAYPFYAESDGELTVEAGEIVYIVEEKEDGWTFVQNSEGYYGLVPSGYVKKQEDTKPRSASVSTLQVPKVAPVLKPVSPLLSNRGSNSYQAPLSPTPSRKPPQSALRYRAVFKYDARNSNELSFAKGDTIIVTEQTGKNWWKGRIGNREGKFPATYVRELDEKTSPEEQLDRAHAKFTKMTTTYEEKIKRLEAQLAQLNGSRAYTSQ